MEKETYLGDGLYASFNGESIRLRAPRDGGDHCVYLEPEVYYALTDYVTSLQRKANEPVIPT